MAKPSKVKAMVSWPVPKNIKQLRGFLGLIGYYLRFIKQHATIVAPLTNLLKKDAFKWFLEAENAFEAFKKTMTSTPVLRLTDFAQPFVLEIDASNIGVGTVLMQMK